LYWGYQFYNQTPKEGKNQKVKTYNPESQLLQPPLSLDSLYKDIEEPHLPKENKFLPNLASGTTTQTKQQHYKSVFSIRV
jgi:hypothetical protein